MVKLNLMVVVLVCTVGHVTSDLQDMTWVMDMEKISYFPTYDSPEYMFNYKVGQKGSYGDIPFVAFNSYSTVEHMGTHMDAPYHFNENGLHMDEVPLADLMGALVKINITEKANKSPDAEVIIDDLLAWEDKYGRIPDRSYVLMYSGWDKYYGDNARYLGQTEDRIYHYPGFRASAVQWLVDNRNILGIGADTISCDPGNNHDFSAHLAILTANKLCVENLKNVAKVPDCGARFMMLPIMMKGGTGTQGRAMAEWYPGVGYRTDCKAGLKLIESFFQTGSAISSVPSLIIMAISVVAAMVFVKRN